MCKAKELPDICRELKRCVCRLCLEQAKTSHTSVNTGVGPVLPYLPCTSLGAGAGQSFDPRLPEPVMNWIGLELPAR